MAVSAWFREASDYNEDRRVVPVGDVLRRWAKRAGVMRQTDRDRVWAAWERLLGPDAGHTRLEGLRNHVAYFGVDSSALLSELSSWRKQELLEGLHREVRAYFVRELRFRLEKRRP
jgi:predicted nucleic acid-binding Zn ribbon protein